MNRNIALIRYLKFEGDLLLLEQLTSASAKTAAAPMGQGAGPVAKTNYKTITDQLAEAPPELLDLYHLLTDHMLGLGDDVQTKTTAYYVAFRRIKNFASVELRNQAKKLLVYLRVDPVSLVLEEGFTRDVRKIGHFGTGDLEVVITDPAQFEKAKPLFEIAYQAS